MRLHGAVIKEQGVTFAIVIVKRYVIDSSIEADKAVRAYQRVFPGVPVVLMAQDNWGTPTYYGRTDIARFLSNVPLEAIPWKEYTLN